MSDQPTPSARIDARLECIATLLLRCRMSKATRDALATAIGLAMKEAKAVGYGLARDELASAIREVLMVAIPSGDPGGASLVSASAMHSLRTALASTGADR